MAKNRLRAALFCSIVGALTVGCGGETITVGPPPTPPPSTIPVASTPTVVAVADVAPTGPTAMTYADQDFVEADTNRDPFRAYTNLFVPHTVEPGHIQREVIMGQTAVDEMHLIAIVSGVANPSAMLVGHDGTGHTVHRGDFVGRAEVVQTGGEDSVPVTLNWRVERIRDDAVILSREDPTAPNRPPLTREIALHDPSEVEADG